MEIIVKLTVDQAEGTVKAEIKQDGLPDCSLWAFTANALLRQLDKQLYERLGHMGVLQVS